MATFFKDSKGNKILVQSLTFGYLEDVEAGIVDDKLASIAVLDATDLTNESLRALTRVEVNKIFEIIQRETYPELFNEDGTEKEGIFDASPDDDKKKA